MHTRPVHRAPFAWLRQLMTVACTYGGRPYGDRRAGRFLADAASPLPSVRLRTSGDYRHALSIRRHGRNWRLKLGVKGWPSGTCTYRSISRRTDQAWLPSKVPALPKFLATHFIRRPVPPGYEAKHAQLDALTANILGNIVSRPAPAGAS